MRLANSRKGFALSEVPSLAVLFVLIFVVLGVGATVLDQTRQTQCSGTIAGVAYTYANNTCYATMDTENKTLGGPISWNSTSYGLTGVNTLASWGPTWAVIIAAAVVIGVIAAYLMFGKR